MALRRVSRALWLTFDDSSDIHVYAFSDLRVLCVFFSGGCSLLENGPRNEYGE